MQFIFCFFAEDTKIFEKDIFSNYIKQCTQDDGSDLSEALDTIFNVMDQTSRIDLPNVIKQFPYVNGGLFHQQITIPQLGYKARKVILECGELNWGDINPDIFGSMFQGVVTPELRGNFGMHYTSVPNILKLIQPLFLNDLEEAFAKAWDNEKQLNALLIRISKMKFFDPACGSGNFLIITYKELRKLEIRIWKRIAELSGSHAIPYTNISIMQFYGIELDNFAHEVAMLSLWLAEHQMNALFSKAFSDVHIQALPLKNIDNIRQGNACRVDWNEVCPHSSEEEVFVMGNPPYLGAGLQENYHKEDMKIVFNGISDYKKLDYISCWFVLASRYTKDTTTKFAFVTTNSICQGEQVPLLWKQIFEKKLEIYFSYKPFLWKNNAKENAAVAVTIIGLRNIQNSTKKYFGNEQYKIVDNINGYLINYKNIFITPQRKSISNFPEMIKGCSPGDGSNLILSDSQMKEIINQFPESKVIIRKYYGADEFVNSKKRFCLWITEPLVELAYSIPDVSFRIEKCKSFRLKSKKEATQKKASIPHFFDERKYKELPSIIIPQTGSEKRKYLPMGMLQADCVISNAARIVYNGDMTLFGILISNIHMVWIRAIAGRLKNDMQYSNTLCYNTFPFPQISLNKKKIIEALAEEVLLTRENHSEKTLAEMYDPDKMPADLRAAHHALDLAVDGCYQSAPFNNDEERLACLFKLYEKMTK